jgi:methionine-S-sulfoxide reductase
VRTRVGYTGGTTDNPTYRTLGDHIETVEMDYDPSVVSYEKLLDVFWASHDPAVRPWRRQYMSVIFYHNDEQKRAAVRTRDAYAGRRKGRVVTEIVPASRFYLAEGYHQKHALRGRPEFMKEVEDIYPSLSGLLASTAVTRLNGYVAGYGTCAILQEELEGLGLSSIGRKRLMDTVCGHGGKRSRGAGDACPAV